MTGSALEKQSFSDKEKLANLESPVYGFMISIVRGNDRGPFVPGRILDLSYAAAKKIGLVATGMTEVKIEILRP